MKFMPPLWYKQSRKTFMREFMKKIILLSIFSICTTTNTAEKTSVAEKTVVFHCPRAILAQLPRAERNVMLKIGIIESFSHATLTESQVRERVSKACFNYNAPHRCAVISPLMEKQTADKLIAISVPVTTSTQAKL
jgi:hypothetical protein